MDKDKTKSQSSFSGPPSRKLTLTIPQAQHQLSSSNHSALSVYSYCDLLTNNLIINNAKEWPTLATIWSKTPEGTIFQGNNLHTTNDSKSISFPFIQRYRRYLAILFKSIFCIHDKYLFYRTRVRSLFTLVTHSLTNCLTDSLLFSKLN